MISPEEAAERAIGYFDRLYPAVRSENALLEEVEPSQTGREWKVTIGYDLEKTVPPGALEEALAKAR